MSGRRFDPATKAYFSLIEEINKMGNGYNLQKFIKELSKIIHERTNFEDVSSYINNLKYEVNGDNRLLKLLLVSVEEGWDWMEQNYCQGLKGAFKYHTNDISSSSSNISIEHIYPKTPKIIEIELEEHKHSVGNLCLMYSNKNSILGDTPFLDKIGMYKSSGFNITRHVSNNKKWDVEEVAKHQELMLQMAAKIFNI